jgi:hypothetical protein
MRRETRAENWRMMGFSGPNSGQIGQEEEAEFFAKEENWVGKTEKKNVGRILEEKL